MLDGSMDLDKVNMFLGSLLELNAENMYRYKGLLAVSGADERFVFQVCCCCAKGVCMAEMLTSGHVVMLPGLPLLYFCFLVF